MIFSFNLSVKKFGLYWGIHILKKFVNHPISSIIIPKHTSMISQNSKSDFREIVASYCFHFAFPTYFYFRTLFSASHHETVNKINKDFPEKNQQSTHPCSLFKITSSHDYWYVESRHYMTYLCCWVICYFILLMLLMLRLLPPVFQNFPPI